MSKLDMESTCLYGAEPGMGQSVKESWHPGLFLDKTIVSVPEAAPGDYVFWYCNMIHNVLHRLLQHSDSSVVYIPVIPLCSYNIANLAEQKKSFFDGVPPPDIMPRDGEEQEKEYEDIWTLKGKRIIGFAPFDVDEEGIMSGKIRIRILENEAMGV